MSKGPAKQKPTKEQLELEELMKSDLGKGTSQLPSDCAFELPWHENDPAWAWLDALDALHKRQDLAPLLALVPEHARVFVKDYFEIFLLAPKRGPKTALWDAGSIERAARMVGQLRKEEGLTVAAAGNRVLEDHPWIAEEIAREKQIIRKKPNTEQQTPQEKLKDHYTGGTRHGYRWKKRRP